MTSYDNFGRPCERADLPAQQSVDRAQFPIEDQTQLWGNPQKRAPDSSEQGDPDSGLRAAFDQAVYALHHRLPAPADTVVPAPNAYTPGALEPAPNAYTPGALEPPPNAYTPGALEPPPNAYEPRPVEPTPGGLVFPQNLYSPQESVPPFESVYTPNLYAGRETMNPSFNGTFFPPNSFAPREVERLPDTIVIPPNTFAPPGVQAGSGEIPTPPYGFPPRDVQQLPNGVILSPNGFPPRQVQQLPDGVFQSPNGFPSRRIEPIPRGDVMLPYSYGQRERFGRVPGARPFSGSNQFARREELPVPRIEMPAPNVLPAPESVEPSLSEKAMQQLRARFRPEQAGDLNARFQFNVNGQGGGTWIAWIRNGHLDLHRADPRSHIRVDSVLSIDARTLTEILRGRLRPDDAVRSGKLSVGGDTNLALRLVPIFFEGQTRLA